MASVMRYGDEGFEVLSLQRALLRHGEDLPLYGTDGDFGAETADALERFASAHGLSLSRYAEVPEEILDALGLDEPPEVPACSGGLDLEGVKLYDLRDEQADPHPKSKLARGRTVRRAASAIDSIVLHQTAVRFSAADEHKLARRALRVACHVMAFYDGFVAWPADLRLYIHHASRANSRSIGVEVDGNYPGLIGGPSTNDHPVTPVTDKVIHAARMGVKLAVEEGRRLGCPIRRIFAHRQFDSWRRADPGQELYQRVVLDYAVPVLELEHDPTESFPHPKGILRHGKPVPPAWHPDGIGRY